MPLLVEEDQILTWLHAICRDAEVICIAKSGKCDWVAQCSAPADVGIIAYFRSLVFIIGTYMYVILVMTQTAGFASVFKQAPRPTQLHSLCGTRNEYRPVFIPGIFFEGGDRVPPQKKQTYNPSQTDAKLCAVNLFFGRTMNNAKILRKRSFNEQ